MQHHRRSTSVLSVASSLADLSISCPTQFIPPIDGTQLMEIDELHVDTHANTGPDTEMAHPQDPRHNDAGHLIGSYSSGGFTDHVPAGGDHDKVSSGGFTDKEGPAGGDHAEVSSGGFTDKEGPAGEIDGYASSGGFTDHGGATGSADDERSSGGFTDREGPTGDIDGYASSGGFTDHGATGPAWDSDPSGGFTDHAHRDTNPRVTPLQFPVDGKTRWEDVYAQHSKWTQSAATQWRAIPAAKRYTNKIALAPSLEQRSTLPRAKPNTDFEVPVAGEVIELSEDEYPPVEFPGNSLTKEVFQHSRIQKKTHSGLSERGHPVSGELPPAEYIQWLRDTYNISPTYELGESMAFPPPAGISYNALASASKEVGPHAKTYDLSFAAGAAELCNEEVAIAIANTAAAHAISIGMAPLTALLP